MESQWVGTHPMGPRVLLDACVLYPTVLREILAGCAKAGLYDPRWSARITEEWVRAARKIGPEAELIARGEAAALDVAFPQARVPVPEGLLARLWLPDPNDIHVLAAAIASHADAILTFNAADFPKNVLADEGIDRIDPDTFLLSLRDRAPDRVDVVLAGVAATASRLSGQPWTPRALLRKLRLWRMAKAVS
jgi:hypothetical protein